MAKVIKNSAGKVLVSSDTAFKVDASIDSNIVAGNIKKDVEILGVTGTYEGSGGGGNVFVSLTSMSLDGYYLASNGVATPLPFDPMTLSSEFSCMAGSFIYCYTDMTEVRIISGATIISSQSIGRPATYFTLLQANTQ